MQETILLIRTLVLVVGLAALSIEDLWKKQVSSWTLVVMGLSGALLSIMGGAWTDWRILFHFVPGCLILGISWISKESIGYGDGLVVLCLGCFLTGVQILNLNMISITLAGITALFLLLVRKKGRKMQIPFIPFLLGGYAIMILA